MSKMILRKVLVGFLLFAGLGVHANSASNRVTTMHGQEIFVSGINVAWNKFGADVGDQPLDSAWFAEMLQAVADSGGNSVRWWLFTNASKAPSFDAATKLVNGPGVNTIPNIKLMLDMAHERGIMVSLCLLSFDMMKISQQGVDIEANVKMMTTDEGRKAFIDNAVVPLVQAIGLHPAILCWELFNEPEGMVLDIAGDWGGMDHSVGIVDVQKMVNQATGAIHRAMPGVPVSNGSWAFIASSFTVDNDQNYYSDSALVEVGGDKDGTLDFYMVHYYEWAGRKRSPFHHPASYWGLDKPLVIAEFSAHGLSDSLGGMDAEACWKYLYNNGYAGAMGWTYTAHDGHGSLEDAALGMRWLMNEHPEDALIDFPPLASDDWFSALTAVQLSVDAPGVLANDLDPTAGAVISASIGEDPKNGSIALAADGSFTYTSDAGFRGTDKFSYVVSDQNGVGSPGFVTVQVYDPAVEQVTPVSDGTKWDAAADWGNSSVGFVDGTLQANLASYAGPSFWVWGTGDNKISLESKQYTVSVIIANDQGSPWDSLVFHPTNSVGDYGPDDLSADMVQLSATGGSNQGFVEYTGTFTPSAAGEFAPALLLAWDPSDGNGPMSDHASKIRAFVVVPSDEYVDVLDQVKTDVSEPFQGRYFDLLGREVSKPLPLANW